MGLLCAASPSMPLSLYTSLSLQSLSDLHLRPQAVPSSPSSSPSPLSWPPCTSRPLQPSAEPLRAPLPLRLPWLSLSDSHRLSPSESKLCSSLPPFVLRPVLPAPPSSLQGFSSTRRDSWWQLYAETGRERDPNEALEDSPVWGGAPGMWLACRREGGCGSDGCCDSG